MRDIVEKYQYYMTEAARLQELVETQNRYIEDLESAIIEIISEENHPYLEKNKAMLDCVRSCSDYDVDSRQACKERCWKEHSVKEAIDRTPHSAENPLHSDPHLAKIVDHNARVTGHLGGGNRVSLDHIKAGRELVDAAKAAGHHGLRVDEKTGHVVPFDSHEVTTYLGSHYKEMLKNPVRAWSKPHESESGEHHWGQHTENGWGMGPF